MSHQTTSSRHGPSETGKTTTFKVARSHTRSAVAFANSPQRAEAIRVTGPTAGRHPLVERQKWRDQEYRQAYMEAAVEQGIAWQIRANRELRGWNQEHLAGLLKTGQPAISRYEDPTYGAYRLETLTQMAHAFDCALTVRFVPYSTLAVESEDLSPRGMYAAPYSEELGHEE